MDMRNKGKNRGVSIRLTHFLTLILGAVMILLLVFSTYQSSNVFTALNKATGNYIVRQKAANDLMEASDYLTEMAQRFTLEGDTQYLDNYFEEAFVNKRRETSITTMAENEAEQALVEKIQTAMNESNALMHREYYAMRLVIEAKEYRNYPETLRGVELKEEDSLLSAEEKMDLAQKMVMGTEYYAKKEIIRNNLKASLSTMEKLMNATRQETTVQLNRELSVIRGIIMILAVLILAMIGLSAWLGTIPLIRAEKAAKAGEPIPDAGAREFRYLAGEFNKMRGAERQTDD